MNQTRQRLQAFEISRVRFLRSLTGSVIDRRKFHELSSFQEKKMVLEIAGELFLDRLQE